MPRDTGIDVGRSRFADVVLLTTLLIVAVGIGLAADAFVDPIALSVGVGGVLVLAVATRGQRAQVRELWTRQPVRLGSILLVLVGLTVGAATVPGPSISASVGALATVLVLRWGRPFARIGGP